MSLPDRSRRRHQTKVKHTRRKRIWKAIHGSRGYDLGHKVKFWPMRCRCDWCTLGRTRHQHEDKLDYEDLL